MLLTLSSRCLCVLQSIEVFTSGASVSLAFCPHCHTDNADRNSLATFVASIKYVYIAYIVLSLMSVYKLIGSSYRHVAKVQIEGTIIQIFVISPSF